MAKVKLPKTIYVRIAEPGTEDEFMLTGTTPEEVDDTNVSGTELSDNVGRYVLAGQGSIKHTAPVYLEDGG